MEKTGTSRRWAIRPGDKMVHNNDGPVEIAFRDHRVLLEGFEQVIVMTDREHFAV